MVLLCRLGNLVTNPCTCSGEELWMDLTLKAILLLLTFLKFLTFLPSSRSFLAAASSNVMLVGKVTFRFLPSLFWELLWALFFSIWAQSLSCCVRLFCACFRRSVAERRPTVFISASSSACSAIWFNLLTIHQRFSNHSRSDSHAHDSQWNLIIFLSTVHYWTLTEISERERVCMRVLWLNLCYLYDRSLNTWSSDSPLIVIHIQIASSYKSKRHSCEWRVMWEKDLSEDHRAVQ